ncbi:whirlin-like [Physella acuta]|uniref:whirlin-like n=1 Tax=Physella acuta TaxID=109671 RepID=UPI0027DBA6EA|nr:whirlin-like [Physella acuta]
MALLRSRSTEFLPTRSISSSTRKLQEALYTHLDDLEKGAFIEALSSYGRRRDVFELVNALRKILNTPVKRQLFPLVRRVIRPEDGGAFDLLTRGDQQHSTLPRPYLFRPHLADLNVLNKYRSGTLSSAGRRAGLSETNGPTVTVHRSGQREQSEAGPAQKHKTMTRRSSNSHRGQEGEIIEVELGEPNPDEAGYGFTIRGGVDIGVGVYVSSVDPGGLAEKNGLEVGDLILEVNNISFTDVTHDEAARIIKAATRLHVTVSRVGRIPGTMTVLEAYKWTDPKGRPVSPPLLGSGPGSGEDEGRDRSGTLMLKGSDERKVNIVVQRGQGLGLMIRGGSEYGLGIFISGVDPFSVAENAGLKPGDQILDVNGRNFLTISHAEAVKHLKHGRHVIMTLRDVGKIPFAKTTIDETGWVESTRIGSYDQSTSSRGSTIASISDLDVQKKLLRAVNPALTSAGGSTPRGQLSGQASLLLNSTEQTALNYYLAEYDKQTIAVQGLLQALFELLNTPAKLTLMSAIRTCVLPKDLVTFDQLVAKQHLDRSLNDARKVLAPERMSILSFDSDDGTRRSEDHRRTLFSHPTKRLHVMDVLDFDPEDDLTPSHALKSEAYRTMSRSTPEIGTADNVHYITSTMSRPRSKSPHSAGRQRKLMKALTQTPTPHRPRADSVGRTNSKVDDPSDDSGVDIHGQPTNHEDSSANHNSYLHHYLQLQQKPARHYTGTGNNQNSHRVVHHVAEVHQADGHFDDVNDSSTISSNDDRHQTIQHSDQGRQLRSRSKSNSRPHTPTVTFGHDDVINGGMTEDVDIRKPHHGVSHPPSTRQPNRPTEDDVPASNVSNKTAPIHPSRHSTSGFPRNQQTTITINGTPMSPSVSRHHPTSNNSITSTPPDNLTPDDNHLKLTKPRAVKLARSNKVRSPVPDRKPVAASLFQRQPNPTPSSAIIRLDSSAPTPPQEPANQKQRRFSSPTKNSPKKSASSKYSSAKPTASVAVPLIKINPQTHPHAEAASSRLSMTSQAPSATINVTSNYVNDTVNHTDTVSRLGKNVVNILVGGASPPTPKQEPCDVMDGCLGQKGFRLPRPEVYTPVELAHMDDQSKIEAIKKKAAEKYGEIPLEVVYIYRSKPTLGVAIEGGANTRQPLPKVINVQPGGSAYESGGLRVGHVILEVNGQPAVGLSHMDAARLIAESFKNKNSDRMELLVTEWSSQLLDAIRVDVGLLKV